jgi:hypothetical protein
MAHWKSTLIFQTLSGVGATGSPVQRTGGFSESWYLDQTSAAQVDSLTRTLAGRRAAMLPTGTSVIGARYQTVDPIGPSTSAAFFYPGQSGESEVPQSALLIPFRSTSGLNRRPFLLRALPDSVVASGEYTRTQWDTLLNLYLQTLGQQGWQFRARDRTQAIIPYVTIDGNGLVTFAQNHPYGFGNFLFLYRAHDTNGHSIRGVFPVMTIPTPSTLTLGNWPAGILSKQGSTRVRGTLYPGVVAPLLSAIRVVQRKIGRPFLGYRGRASRKR